jgi:putative ABC transport system substrate-binding protein
MRRREFIALIGCGAAWPLAAMAQQPARIQRIGVLMGLTVDDPEGQARRAAFQQGLVEQGLAVERTVEIIYRWGGANPESIHRYAAELVALAPDVILATSGATVGAVQQASRSVPIVFVGTVDPVGSGFVDSLARPGGNATGFSAFEYSLSGKWLELLKQIAPDVTRAVVFRDTANPAGNAQFSAIQTVAASLGVEVSPIGMRDAGEIERSVAAFARTSNGGLIVTGSPTVTTHRNLITSLAIRHKLPAVYPFRFFVTDGGLVSYGPDFVDQYRRSAGYVARILKGEKPADMAVQAPTTYQLVINLKTARAIGITIPASLLARADEVIE